MLNPSNQITKLVRSKRTCKLSQPRKDLGAVADPALILTRPVPKSRVANNHRLPPMITRLKHTNNITGSQLFVAPIWLFSTQPNGDNQVSCGLTVSVTMRPTNITPKIKYPMAVANRACRASCAVSSPILINNKPLLNNPATNNSVAGQVAPFNTR